MKRMIPVLLALCLLAAPLMRVSAAENPSPAELSFYQPGDVPADGGELDAIQLPITALVMAMVERDLTYDGNSDEFIWDALYYMLGMYGQVDSRADVTGNLLTVPAETVQDYMAALFGHASLPDVPAALAGAVTYQDGEYLLTLGDFGQSETRLGTLQRGAGGLCRLPGELVDPADGSVLCRFEVTLMRSENMFGFSILDLVIG